MNKKIVSLYLIFSVIAIWIYQNEHSKNNTSSEETSSIDSVKLVTPTLHGKKVEPADTTKQIPHTKDTNNHSDSGRSKEAIRSVVMKEIGSLRHIYNGYLKSEPNLAGRITVKMVIAPSGNIIKVTILESSFTYPELEQEIIEKIRHWKFNTVEKGTATVIYPFNFSS